MVEEDLGEATIVYEDPDDGTAELTVENEHVAYFQDHWIVKTGESEAGQDTVRRIPASRVYYVEREVEEFEREIGTAFDELQSVATEFERGVGSIREEVQSVAGELQSVFSGGQSSDQGDGDVIRIDIEDGDDESETSSDVGDDDE